MYYNKKITCSLMCVFLAVLLIALSAIAPVGAVESVKVNPESKIDPALKEKMETASPDEKIPVYIWYDDIDHKQVEREVEQETNLTLDTLEEDIKMPSVSLINSYKNKDAGAIREAQEYLKATKELRGREREKTNTYINTKRQISKEKYEIKSAEIIQNVGIVKNDIIFNSKFAPMLLAVLSTTEIQRIVKDSRIEKIYLFNEKELQNFDIAVSKQALNQTQVVDLFGLTGDGVKIGMIEAYGHPDVYSSELLNVNISMFGSNSSGHPHATNVANILVGANSGFAPNAELVNVYVNREEYERIVYYYYALYVCIEQMIQEGVQIINCSSGSERDSIYDELYSAQERWMDHVVSFHNVSFITAAGNEGYDFPAVSDMGMGYNTITVGAYDDNDTTDFTDDQMEGYSSYLNIRTEINVYGIEKPDVIMPGNLLRNTIKDIEGTSYATPMLTGSLALMFEFKPSLAAFPQAVKAIVLASCHRKVLPSTQDEAVETMQQGITERQGAGVPDIWTMICIISQGTYGIGVMDASDTVTSRHFTIPKYGANNMNVSLTWLRDSSLASMDAPVVGEYVDLNLNVYREGETLPVGVSAKQYSSTEMTYFGLSSLSNEYEFRITKAQSGADVKYGFAYSTDNMYATPVMNDGIYRIKSLTNNKYMTLDTATNEITLENYSGEDTQQWIIKSGAAYQISSAYSNIAGMINSGTAIDSTFNNAVLGNGTLNFTFVNWENNSLNNNDGVAYFYTYISGKRRLIESYGDEVVIAVESNTRENHYWILEEVNYRRGDVNQDGTISIKDTTRIEKYLAGIVALTNKEMFLADADYSGQITVADKDRINQIIAGLVIY